jgi:hypothetical protein
MSIPWDSRSVVVPENTSYKESSSRAIGEGLED